MAFIVSGNKIEYESDGQILGEVCFPSVSHGTVDICHTFVDVSLQGQGIAAQLVKRAVEEIRRTNRKAVATCSYAAGWFAKHPDASDILV